ncbi:acyl-homoserine lactone acylase PvdQ [Sphingopyxis panaciterrae]|uniref:penicillin acylase family protein n=1 Tax=Sphingopyxis panaciterrae TaxID=363841 RepID=UPI00142054DA|nr:penicillin acylase family protein [Sphingopyxis panaciterrae]NIJ39413.1 acyl-homoserine lactone acylase PvdQ [Sphingopyxis panaciterrae]
MWNHRSSFLRGASCLAFLSATVSGAHAEDASAEKVTIYRGEYGVPHVVADTSDAVMFGAGYAIASDRLAAMELARYNTQGRRAELVGKSAIESDKMMRGRRLSDAQLLQRYRALAPEHQKMIQAMVDGINKRIDEVGADPERLTPLEFIRWGIRPTRWSLAEYLALISAAPLGRDTYEIRNLEFLKAMTARYGQDKAWQIFNDVVPISDPDSPTTIPAGDDLAPARPVPVPVLSPAQLAPNRDLVSAAAQTAPTEPVKGASRCLVIGPEKSASGKVLMLEATADGPEIHLKGGGFDNTGFGSTGWGVPTMGRGAQHGWLLVSGSSEAGTTFAEKLNPKNRYEYWYKGAWKAMEHRTEAFKVKDGAPFTHEVAWTIHGPVIAWDVENGTAYSQQMGVHGRELDTWVAFAEMGRAKSLAEFKAKGVDRLGWNLGACYGGEDGTIAYFEAGALPKKAAGVDPRLPTPGTGEYEWTGFLTPAEKPQMINPRQGYFMSWNSKATGWSQEGDNARIGATFRTWMGDRLAKAGQSLTLLDMREYNGKIFNALGAVDRNQAAPDFFAPYFREAIAASDDPEVKRAGELMLGFNGLYQDRDADQKYDNPGLTLYRSWLQVAPETLFGDDIGDWWKAIDADRYLTYQSSLLLRAFQGDKAGAPLGVDYFNGRDRTTTMIDTIQAVIAEVKPRFPGQDMAEWKQPIYWKYFDASLETPDRPQMAEDAPEHRLSAVLRLGPTMAPHNGGESWVGLMEIGRDRRALYSVVDAGGQNLFIDPKGKGNPHLADQTMMHETNELKKTPLTDAEIRATAASTETLEYRPTRR